MPYQIIANDEKPLDAKFDIEGKPIVFNSRGGSKLKGGSRATAIVAYGGPRSA